MKSEPTLVTKTKKLMKEMLEENDMLFQRSSDRFNAIQNFMEMMEEEEAGYPVDRERLYNLIMYGGK